ncbi:MAG: Fe-S cluster assembly protein SufD [Vicinamibacterales bacterium]
MTQVVDKRSSWQTALEERTTSGPGWLEELRTRGAARFAALGFPTVRNEEWRFTNVAPIAAAELSPAPPAVAVDDAQLADFPYADAAERLVFVNGRFSSSLSRTSGLPKGVTVGSLATAFEADAAVEGLFGREVDLDQRAFAALNTAFASDGAYISVPTGLVVESPIHVMFVSVAPAAAAGLGSGTMSHPRTLIVLGANSQARVVESYVGLPGRPYLSNAVTEVVVGEHAVLDHYKVQEERLDAFHVASMHIRTARSANVSSHSFTLGAKLTRNDAIATLAGEGSECTLNGLYIGDADRLIDNHTTIDHAVAHCPSHEIYKGILGGKARAVFNGKIIVRQDAQKTDAKQTNRALLLSDDATINTKPHLEIFADDVKCTHGAAIGQLDEDALFYLRARGLTFQEARDMLIHAFAGDILDRVKIEPLKIALERELYAQLAKDLAEVDRK